MVDLVALEHKMRDKAKHNAQKRKYWEECKDFINENRRKPQEKRFCVVCKSIFFSAHNKKLCCSDDCSAKRRKEKLEPFRDRKNFLSDMRKKAKNSISKRNASDKFAKKYTKEEDKLILKCSDLMDVALRIGRTYHSVIARRSRLKKMIMGGKRR
jgi:hypothetical protein